ncbi:hypothetical protein J5X98_01555 [Leptothermofonsia sichuanensis E412]|uniref:hypothetical protein n=1 Tax=Leptothermofonsia sichuanensis TaxID=2917832 RepID=UPI001CA64DF1|nr:hypothetical protein [Leptothermofonsia sichuanensis]QZZ21215.1 hypothetical protein J5X98_01555 [Leptothermofonsia sichuanensis E412]
MNVEEFELQARDVIEQTLNHLQTATLLATELETRIAEAGQSVQALGQLIERFVADQKNQQNQQNQPSSDE